MGEGGLKKRTALQLLHTAYNLTQQYASSEWNSVWSLCTGMACKAIKCPVLSRWEHVNECCEHVLQNKDDWILVSSYIITAEQTGSTKHTIASYLHSYLHENMLLAHLSFLNAYSKAWWSKHFDWQKCIDDKSGSAGFLARHMVIRYYLQSLDLDNLKVSWKTNRMFNDYVRYFPTNNLTYTADQLASDFFERVHDRHVKHFEQWRTKYAYVALAGDSIPATALANWILQQDPPLTQLPIQYESTTHMRTINTQALLSFITNGLHPT